MYTFKLLYFPFFQSCLGTCLVLVSFKKLLPISKCVGQNGQNGLEPQTCSLSSPQVVASFSNGKKHGCQEGSNCDPVK
jgi:hypothetical protein